MRTLTKQIIIEQLSELDDLESKAAAGRVYDHIFNNIKENLIEGRDVKLAGFLNMKPAIQAARPAREGRNPSTGKTMNLPAVPAKNTVRTKLSEIFKRELNA